MLHVSRGLGASSGANAQTTPPSHHLVSSLPVPSSMPLTPEQEINLLFKDVLELAGSPEKGKFLLPPSLSRSKKLTLTSTARSALRNFLWLKEQEADTVPLCCACANELTPAAPPPPASLSSFSAAPILLPPGTGPVRRTIIPPNEHR